MSEMILLTVLYLSSMSTVKAGLNTFGHSVVRYRFVTRLRQKPRFSSATTAFDEMGTLRTVNRVFASLIASNDRT